MTPIMMGGIAIMTQPPAATNDKACALAAVFDDRTLWKYTCGREITWMHVFGSFWVVNYAIKWNYLPRNAAEYQQEECVTVGAEEPWFDRADPFRFEGI